MDQNKEKQNDKKAPFIITTPKEVVSSAYEHMNDFEEKPRFVIDNNGSKVFQKLNPVHEKPNVKAGYTELLIRKVNYQEDPYERKDCIQRFEQLQKKVKIPCPFKCPKNHILIEKEEQIEKNVEYGKRVIKMNLSRLLSATKSKEQTDKLNKLIIKADTLFKSKKDVSNVKKQQNQYGFDKNLFENVDKWKNMLNILEKKEQDELQKSKLSFQKHREVQKQQQIQESNEKKTKKEEQEQKNRERKELKDQQNKEMQKQSIEKQLKYREVQEQRAQKFQNKEQEQNINKLIENPKIDLTPNNKTHYSIHKETTRKFKPATPSSFQKQNQQEVKYQSFNSINITTENNQQIDLQKPNIPQKQKSIVQTPKSNASKLKQTQQQQSDVKSVKSNQQSQKTNSVKKENNIVDQAKPKLSNRSNSQRAKQEEERKSNYYSEERKIQDNNERSRYSEEKKSNRTTTKVNNQEQNQTIVMKPKNFTRASSFKNPMIPKSENSEKAKVRASSSGKRIQDERPLNLNKINLPVKNNKLVNKEVIIIDDSSQKIDNKEQLQEDIKNNNLDQDKQSLGINNNHQFGKTNEELQKDNSNKQKEEMIEEKVDEQQIEFIQQPINEGLLNINDPKKNVREQEMGDQQEQIIRQQLSIEVQQQSQKADLQQQSINSLINKQESSVLKDSLLTESLVYSQFKETKALEKQQFSSQLNEQESINLSESQVTLKSTLQQSQLQQINQ